MHITNISSTSRTTAPTTPAIIAPVRTLVLSGVVLSVLSVVTSGLAVTFGLVVACGLVIEGLILATE